MVKNKGALELLSNTRSMILSLNSLTYVTRDKVCETIDKPYKYVSPIMSKLRKSGLIRGCTRGYMLTGKRITYDSIKEALELKFDTGDRVLNKDLEYLFKNTIVVKGIYEP